MSMSDFLLGMAVGDNQGALNNAYEDAFISDNVVK